MSVNLKRVILTYAERIITHVKLTLLLLTIRLTWSVCIYYTDGFKAILTIVANISSNAYILNCGRL